MSANENTELTSIDEAAVRSRLDQLQNSNLVQIKGGVWGLPYEYDPFGYIYNADLFRSLGLDPDDPPQTWDELRAVSATIKRAAPDAWPICHPLKNLSKIQPYIWGAGGTYWNRDTLPTKSTLLNPGTVAGYEFIDEWAKKEWLNTEEISGSNDLSFMLSRQCAAMNLSSVFVLELQLNDPDTDWRVAPIPAMDEQHEPINFAGGSALIVPSTSSNPKEALDLVLWMTGEEAQRLKWGLDPGLGLSDQDVFTQALPVNRALSEEIKKVPFWTKAFVEVPSRPAGISPVYSDSYEVLAAMQEEIVRQDVDVRETLTAAQEEIQALLDEDIKENPELYQGVEE